uniref:non-specific serine/threonine protein kinase n=1 Tax=Cacopsylla melanoneura TaxID=428564 RepID=A0A8D9ERJ8_9HEMI
MSQDKDNTSKLIKLKGFKIQHKIGSGSFSTVYKAWTENKDHVEVAIKCIDKTKVSGKRFDNIVNEIKVLKLLHHEHIVSMIDFLWDERFRVRSFSLAVGQLCLPARLPSLYGARNSRRG